MIRIWAISDLHLSFARPERREEYAARWRDHAEAIESHWRGAVGRNDLVLVPGDISMARGHRDVQPDLSWLERLPGTKVLCPGNHDRWYNGAAAVRPMLRRTLRVADGDALATHGVIVAGAASAPVPESGLGTAAERRSLEAAAASLSASLAHAARIREERGADLPIYALWHHSPFDRHGIPGPAPALLSAAGVACCAYGHLHARAQWASARRGVIDGVRYECVAADAIGFRPLRLAELARAGAV